MTTSDDPLFQPPAPSPAAVRTTPGQIAFAGALAVHRLGRIAEAADLYADLLRRWPDHIPALCCLSLCRLQTGRAADAIEAGLRAASLDANSSEAWFCLANAQAADGRLDDARASFMRLLTLTPGSAEGHNNLGNVLTAQGQTDAAAGFFSAALRLRPDYAEAYYNLGNLLIAAGRPSDARPYFERAVRIAPGFVQALNNLGATLTALERPQEALSVLARAIALNPDYADARFNLGNAFLASGRPAEAVPHFQAAIASDPGNVGAYANLGFAFLMINRTGATVVVLDHAHHLLPQSGPILVNLGNALIAVGRPEEALHCYDRAVTLDPGDMDALFGRGNGLVALKRLEEAIVCYQAVLASRDDFAEAHSNLGAAFQGVDRLEESRAHLRRAIALKPQSANPYDNLGTTLQTLGHAAEARTAYARAIVLAPSDPRPHNNLGIALTECGRFEDARERFLTAVALDPANGHFHRMLAEAGPVHPLHLRQMEELLRDHPGLPETDCIELLFALWKAYNDAGRPDEAMRALIEGNRRKRATFSFDGGAPAAAHARIRTAFPAGRLATPEWTGPEWTGPEWTGPAPGPVPLFIVGMPRSGTTLIEQILASHPQVFAAGELRDLRRLADRLGGFPECVPGLPPGRLARLGADYLAGLRSRAPGFPVVVDKMPGNFQLIGLIRLALPQARIVHAVRDPVDTCLSCYSRLFAGPQPWSYDLGDLGRHYRAYASLMDYWRAALPEGVMIDVRYEDLVADIRGQAGRLLAHCGLPWDDRCLAFHRTERVVRTASATQVRRPLYTSSVGRARQWGPLLQPLLEALNGTDGPSGG